MHCREKVLMTELKLFGIPYQWVQLLCGLDFLSGSPTVSIYTPVARL